MSYGVQLKIPATQTKDFKLYIYRSTKAEQINTIAKIKTIQPVMVVDELNYTEALVDGKYVVLDRAGVIPGIEYLGPEPNAIPVTEYEHDIAVQMRPNGFSFYTILNIKPLELNYNGVIYYYSIIGVKDGNVTHLSKVNAIVLQSDYQNLGSREILSCEDYVEGKDNIWTSVSVVGWNEAIVVGDLDNSITYSRFGNPFISTVPVFKPEEIIVDNRCTNTERHNYIRVPNVWRINDKKYNTRKLKSYKICNIYDGKRGGYSEPSFQTVLPLPIEKMLIFKKDITSDISNMDIPIAATESENLLLTIIKKDGVYYNEVKHNMLETNKYTIDTTLNDMALYNESSAQEYITLQCEAIPEKIYQYTFYLQDGYGTYSTPVNIIVKS